MAEKDDEARARLLPLMGEEGLAALEGARVMVVGLGGVGSSCAEALARGRVGHLVLVDRDVVEASNINRQALAFHSTIGQAKVDVMASMVADINPTCEVERIHAFVAPADVTGLLERVGSTGRVDYVVDAIDTVAQKLALAEECERRGIPLVSSMGGANKVEPERLRFADVSQTRVCRMSRTMRKECRKRGISHLEVLFSDEEPFRPRTEAGSSHGGATKLGTASYMPPIMGQMLAGHVIRAIAGLGRARWPGDGRC